MRRPPLTAPVIPRTLPRSAVDAARRLAAASSRTARAEHALALALRRYIRRADRWTDRALIEAVARTRIRTR